MFNFSGTKRIHRIAGVFIAAILFVFAASADMQSHLPYKSPTTEFLERFHGHLGPFVALGAKMGMDAVETRGIPKFFGLTVEVTCPDKPPHSCLLDGLQVGTGATMGKRNLILEPGKEIRVLITCADSTNKVTYRIKPAVQEELAKWEKEGVDVEERGHILFARAPSDLFDITEE